MPNRPVSPAKCFLNRNWIVPVRIVIVHQMVVFEIIVKWNRIIKFYCALDPIVVFVGSFHNVVFNIICGNHLHDIIWLPDSINVE